MNEPTQQELVDFAEAQRTAQREAFEDFLNAYERRHARTEVVEL
jgi:hypothetical protein